MSTLSKWFRVIVCQWLLSILIFIIIAMSLRNLADYWRTANWIEGEGGIVSLSATTSNGSEPNSHWSGNGNLSCQYSYTFQGKRYSGNKIGIETFEDSSSRGRRYRLLKSKLNEGKPITVLVNPAVPTESALFREIMSEMYFGPAIGLMWFGALFWNHHRKCRFSS
jgi:hypothetical protein